MQTSATRYDALVIGAGPAGATAALMLARAGWSVALVERSPFPRRKVCGEFLSATSFPLLFELGVAEAFLSRAGPEIRRVGLFAAEHALSAPMPKVSGGFGAFGRALGREHLDLLLLHAAGRAGAKIWQPYTVIALEQEAGGWVCRLSGKGASEEIRTRIVIAAHGSWERGALGLPRRNHDPADLLGFKAHFFDCALEPDLMPLLLFPGGYGGMVRSDSGRVSLSCCVRRDVLEACRRKAPAQHAGDAVFQHIRASCASVRDITTRARLSDAWLSAGPIRPGIRASFEGRLFRVGNIAGEAHPIIAEGISMAMQSAGLLCRALIAAEDDIADDATLASIGRVQDARWRARFGLRIHAAEALAQLALRRGTAGLLVQPVRMFPALLTWGAALAGKTAMVQPQVSAAGNL